jgi:hypothetical protein
MNHPGKQDFWEDSHLINANVLFAFRFELREAHPGASV